MNAAEMIDAVLTRTNTAAADKQITRAVVLGFVNEAVRRYQTGEDWPWLDSATTQSLVANQYDYSLPSNTTVVRHVRYRPTSSPGLETVLYRVQLSEIEALDRTAQGAPDRFAVVPSPSAPEGVVRVWPTPPSATGVLDLHVTLREAALTDGSGSSPKLPDELCDVLVDHACARVYLAKGDERSAGTCPMVDHAVSMSRLRRANARRRGTPRPRALRW